MPVMNQRVGRCATRTVTVPTTVALVWALSAPPALAHTELVGSDPADGASVTALPERVRPAFSDPIPQRYAKVAVTDPAGDPATSGKPAVADKNVEVSLDTDETAGAYTVAYRLGSADGHPVSGTLSFTVKTSPGPTGSAGPTVPGDREEVEHEPSAASPKTPPADGGASSSSTSETLLRVGATVLIIAGGWISARILRRRRDRHGA